MKVTARSHPALFQALEVISHDRGSGAGHSNYHIPQEYTTLVDSAEIQLRSLTETQFEEFTIGEFSEVETLRNIRHMEDAHKLLDAFFNDFEVSL